MEEQTKQIKRLADNRAAEIEDIGRHLKKFRASWKSYNGVMKDCPFCKFLSDKEKKLTFGVF